MIMQLALHQVTFIRTYVYRGGLYIRMLNAKYGFRSSEDFAVQTSDPHIILCKPWICTQSSRIAQPNLGHLRQQPHNRSRKQSSSAICGNEVTIDHTSTSNAAQQPTGKETTIDNSRKAARPFMAANPRSIMHALQLCRQRSHHHQSHERC